MRNLSEVPVCTPSMLCCILDELRIRVVKFREDLSELECERGMECDRVQSEIAVDLESDLPAYESAYEPSIELYGLRLHLHGMWKKL